MPAAFKVVIESLENEKLQANREKAKSFDILEQGYAREDEAAVAFERSLVHEHENGGDKLGKVRHNIEHAIGHYQFVDFLFELVSCTQM